MAANKQLFVTVSFRKISDKLGEACDNNGNAEIKSQCDTLRKIMFCSKYPAKSNNSLCHDTNELNTRNWLSDFAISAIFKNDKNMQAFDILEEQEKFAKYLKGYKAGNYI